MKRLSLLIALGFLVFTCSDDNEITDNEINSADTDQSQLIGQWKLIYFHARSWDSYIFDLADKDIVYDFKPNGILVVGGDGDPNVPHTDGQHSYVFGEGTIDGHSDKSLIVKIDDQKWSYFLSDGHMMISLAYLDGGNLTFIRK